MKGYRFYVEFENNAEKRRTTLNSSLLKFPRNCIALFLDENNKPIYQIDNKGITYEGFVAVFFHQNSPVNVSGISAKYLDEKCKKCSEKLARKLHPELFNRIDDV